VMSYSWQFANTPAGRVLKTIQMRGRASIKDVAADLGVTTSAVRLHLTQLQATGAIEAEKVREGVGRPHYGELARLLLVEVGETQGREALQSVLRRVGTRMAAHYQSQVGGQELADRISAWAELLDQRGVTVEIDETAEGYVLREFGCPYQNVALENRAVCEMERQVMARLLESGVKLTQCVLDGYRGCQFTIVAEN
jgi:DeoR family suf operon transcriptional repressor